MLTPPDDVSTQMGHTAVVFFCHGSRDPHWRAPFDQILHSFRSHYPGVRAELAFLELMTPDLATTLDNLCAAGCWRIRVIPLFLAPGAHTRRDLPALLEEARRRWPDLQVQAGETLTEAAVVRRAMVDWAALQIGSMP